MFILMALPGWLLMLLIHLMQLGIVIPKLVWCRLLGCAFHQ